MIEVPHKEGDLVMPLIYELQDVDFFHNRFSVSMTVSECNDSKSFFL